MACGDSPPAGALVSVCCHGRAQPGSPRLPLPTNPLFTHARAWAGQAPSVFFSPSWGHARSARLPSPLLALAVRGRAARGRPQPSVLSSLSLAPLVIRRARAALPALARRATTARRRARGGARAAHPEQGQRQDRRTEERGKRGRGRQARATRGRGKQGKKHVKGCRARTRTHFILFSLGAAQGRVFHFRKNRWGGRACGGGATRKKKGGSP
jgi:hypothetical protein